MTKLKLCLLFPITVILFANSNVFACMCGHTSVCDAYMEASAIVIAKVKFIKNPSKNGKLTNQKVILTIGQTFKGLKQKEIILSQPSSTCDWWFENENLNKTYLFYLSKFNNKNVYTVISCGRSKGIGDAADDLSWLKRLPSSLNRTRISGTTGLYEDRFSKLIGVSLLIEGNKKQYKLTTDTNGFYEIWDIPFGKYSVTPQIPNNLYVRWTAFVPDNWMTYLSEEYQDKDSREIIIGDKNSRNVKIEPKKCGGVDFTFGRKANEN